MLTVALTCSFTVAMPKNAIALVISSQGSGMVLEQSDAVISAEELNAMKKVGRRIQQLGYSSTGVKARLDELTKEEVCQLANNLCLIQEGGTMSEGEGMLMVAGLVIAVLALMSV